MTTLKRYNGTEWETVSFPSNVGMSPQTLGYSEVTTNQSGIGVGAGGAGIDLNGLSVTVTVPEGRRIRVSGHAIIGQPTAGGWTVMDLKEGSTALGVIFDNHWSSTTNPEIMYDGSVILTPSAGTHTYKLNLRNVSPTVTLLASSTNPAYILVEDITGSTLPYEPSSVPVGALAFAAVMAGNQALTAGGVETILTDYSVNIAVPAGRTLKITVQGQLYSSVLDDGVAVRIKEDGVQIHLSEVSSLTGAIAQTYTVETIRSPSAGSHTYTVTAQRVAGSGTVTHRSNSSAVGYLIVEDITPTPVPANTAPSSTLGYAQKDNNQLNITTTQVDLSGLSVTVTVPAGRRLKIKGFTPGWSKQAATTYVRLVLTRNGTVVQRALTGTPGTFAEVVLEFIDTPAAGTYTYVLRAESDGNMALDAGLSGPSFLLVEDITANSTLTQVDKESVLPFGLAGTLSVGSGTARFYFPHAAIILGVSASAGTAPTGSSAIFDVHKNGTTIFTTQGNRPTIAAGANYSGETIPDVTAIATGEYLTIDRDQVGSTIAGADANILIRYRRP